MLSHHSGRNTSTCPPLSGKHLSYNPHPHSHLLPKKQSHIPHLNEVLGMIVAEGCLRYRHRTTMEALSILKFTLESVPGRRSRRRNMVNSHATQFPVASVQYMTVSSGPAPQSRLRDDPALLLPSLIKNRSDYTKHNKQRAWVSHQKAHKSPPFPSVTAVYHRWGLWCAAPAATAATAATAAPKA